LTSVAEDEARLPLLITEDVEVDLEPMLEVEPELDLRPSAPPGTSATTLTTDALATWIRLKHSLQILLSFPLLYLREAFWLQHFEHTICRSELKSKNFYVTLALGLLCCSKISLYCNPSHA
jgi:hypothetical protein